MPRKKEISAEEQERIELPESFAAVEEAAPAVEKTPAKKTARKTTTRKTASKKASANAEESEEAAAKGAEAEEAAAKEAEAEEAAESAVKKPAAKKTTRTRTTKTTTARKTTAKTAAKKTAAKATEDAEPAAKADESEEAAAEKAAKADGSEEAAAKEADAEETAASAVKKPAAKKTTRTRTAKTTTAKKTAARKTAAKASVNAEPAAQEAEEKEEAAAEKAGTEAAASEEKKPGTKTAAGTKTARKTAVKKTAVKKTAAVSDGKSGEEAEEDKSAADAGAKEKAPAVSTSTDPMRSAPERPAHRRTIRKTVHRVQVPKAAREREAARALRESEEEAAMKARAEEESLKGELPIKGSAAAPQKDETQEVSEAQKEHAASEDNLHRRRSDGYTQAERPEVTGILDIAEGGFGFLRFDNFLTSDRDVYVSQTQIRRFNLKTGDEINGISRLPRKDERFGALLYVTTVNGDEPGVAIRRPSFESLTPIFPNKRYTLEDLPMDISTRMIDLIAPVGRGQRGLIVAPPKAGKTTLLKSVAASIEKKYEDTDLIVLLIDERPEEVTDMKRALKGGGEVIYSTFDERPQHHVKVAEMVLARAKRLAEHKHDVVILLDSITRLARAYNLVIPASGRTLSGGLDPGALYGPKRFFGAARNIEEGGSVTILATALIDTGSRMDDMIYEEFKGTGNMELHLDRRLAERRIYPAIDINRSGTRREELLLSPEELHAVWAVRRAFSKKPEQEVTEEVIDNLRHTSNNRNFIEIVNRVFDSPSY